ncbi:LLM class flavin-dependent oxidoreductase [Streptomyces sp. RB6PN25]|uniref:LLM class flavin-dependent oxidoreductase n=1 Tax=Streptomyces humicola TaxID=2953240 RepID=A0ABT1PNC0_9ACTN|nr:LLM class flavin-dependent oxidoreductase [Streptomyces humicola]MCQ4079170.1 LLM class flavin-dependent oxidoreductase [Streptomyces humicola]
MAPLKLGISDQDGFTTPDPRVRRRLLDRVVEAGLDHVTMGDHISFHDGSGFDGMISATTVLSSHDRLSVIIGVYLLGLRHPMLAARQLSTLSQTAPGRLTLGVGVAGEDRREVSNSGVDPKTRGRRLDEALMLVRRLLDGEEVTHHGEFFRLDEARILPTPEPRIPIVIGGKGDVAVRRTAQFGDGWLGIFCSARRFAETRQRILEAAAGLDREAPSWFGVNVWCGLDADAAQAREMLAAKMEGLYHVPYEKFQYIAPAGTPEQVAELLQPFAESGAEYITLIPVGSSIEAEIDAVAEVKERLGKAVGAT